MKPESTKKKPSAIWACKAELARILGAQGCAESQLDPE